MGIQKETRQSDLTRADPKESEGASRSSRPPSARPLSIRSSGHLLPCWAALLIWHLASFQRGKTLLTVGRPPITLHRCQHYFTLYESGIQHQRRRF